MDALESFLRTIREFVDVMLAAGSDPNPNPTATAFHEFLAGRRVETINAIGYAEVVIDSMRCVDITRLPDDRARWYLSVARRFNEILCLWGLELLGDSLCPVRPPEDYDSCLFGLRELLHEAPPDDPTCLVTLDQAAAVVHRSKRTLERYKTDGKLPVPTFEGGGGRADFWDWETIRPRLEEIFGIKLPNRFPASRQG
jgi:hypothetical protein